MDMRTGADLHKRLSKIEIDKPALDSGEMKPGRWSKRKPGGERWVKPEMVVEVEFTEWTPDGHVRHPSFQGLRTDKPAQGWPARFRCVVCRRCRSRSQAPELKSLTETSLDTSASAQK